MMSSISSYSSCSSLTENSPELEPDSSGSDLEEELYAPNNHQVIQPYCNEPELDEELSHSESEDENQPVDDRQQLEDWCTCKNCTQMDQYVERVCCGEVHECSERLDESVFIYGNEKPYACITNHPGFIMNCLQWEVLENAWYAYKQQYGRLAYDGERHKRLRHIAYRQLARFLFRIVGKENRYVLPSCAVSKIRSTFPANQNEEYTGFMDL